MSEEPKSPEDIHAPRPYFAYSLVVILLMVGTWAFFRGVKRDKVYELERAVIAKRFTHATGYTEHFSTYGAWEVSVSNDTETGFTCYATGKEKDGGSAKLVYDPEHRFVSPEEPRANYVLHVYAVLTSVKEIPEMVGQLVFDNGTGFLGTASGRSFKFELYDKDIPVMKKAELVQARVANTEVKPNRFTIPGIGDLFTELKRCYVKAPRQ